MKVRTLQDKVIESIRAAGLGVGPSSDMQANEIEFVVVHTCRMLGLEMNVATGELYNPAYEGPTMFPAQQNVRFAGMPSRNRNRKLKR